MCGFAGLIGLNGVKAVPEVIDRMAAAIRHRGPDDEGSILSGSVGFGFRRLSILDLSPAGHQPMVSDDGQVILVFNGEIYNYVELRSELQGLGHAFKSSGDSEVLLRAYLQWGTECLSRFNGMWAFLIYDARRGKIVGSRDRFGKKPLYRYQTAGWLLMASEIKSILASGLYRGGPNWPLVSRFFLEGSLDHLDTGIETFYSGIEQFPAGSGFEMDLTGATRSWRFWSLPTVTPEPAVNPEAEFAEVFEDAVRIRLRSDVPVGIFLSGGLDSTAIACAAARLRREAGTGHNEPFYAFSYQADQFDESRYINDTIAQTGVELVTFRPDPRDLWSRIQQTLWFQDEPVHSMVAVITFELSRLAAERGVKVILNGGGADESLAGYPDLFEASWYSVAAEQGNAVVWREIQDFCRVHGGSARSLFLRHLRRRLQAPLRRSASYRALSGWKQQRRARRHPWFTAELSAHLPREDGEFAPPTLEHALVRCMERAPLPFYLRMEDRNSMAHSIEARMPFLDYRLVSQGFRLPAPWKMRGGLNKYVLREAMRGKIPESVRERPDKMGFPVPTADWFAQGLYEPTQDLLASQAVRERGIYNVAAIRKDLESHKRGDVNISREAFSVIQFELWSGLERQHAPTRGPASGT